MTQTMGRHAVSIGLPTAICFLPAAWMDWSKFGQRPVERFCTHLPITKLGSVRFVGAPVVVGFVSSADWRRGVCIRRTDNWRGQIEWEIDQRLDGRKAGGNATIAWSPDSNQLATVSGSGEIAIWKLLENQKTLKLWAIEAHTSVIRCLAWNPDGRRIASGSEDCKVKIWDAKTGRELLSLDGHNRMVWSVAWSPDGRAIGLDGGSLIAH